MVSTTLRNPMYDTHMYKNLSQERKKNYGNFLAKKYSNFWQNKITMVLAKKKMANFFHRRKN